MDGAKTAVVLLKAFLAGCLVGGGLFTGLVLVKGWAVGLVNSPYCGACAALTSGLFITLRIKGPSGWAWLLAGLMGLAVGMGPPLAGWLLAPAAGFTPGPFKAGQQAFLSLISGLAGAYLGGRRSRFSAGTKGRGSPPAGKSRSWRR